MGAVKKCEERFLQRPFLWRVTVNEQFILVQWIIKKGFQTERMKALN